MNEKRLLNRLRRKQTDRRAPFGNIGGGVMAIKPYIFNLKPINVQGRKVWAIITVVLLLFGSYYILKQNKIERSKQNKNQGNQIIQEKTVRTFLVQKVPFSDSIGGLIGTVKGDTIEMAFGSGEEKLVQVHVQVGQSVRKGTVLFELDHTRARARMKQAEIVLNRLTELHSVGGATLQDVQEAQASYIITKKDYDETFIRAPKSGVISEINKRVGETINRNEVVAVLVSHHGQMIVETSVIESQIDQVHKGQTVYVEFGALRGDKFKGKVIGISREVTTSGRMAPVLIGLDQSVQGRLRPGLSAKCQIELYNDITLVIPRTAYDSEKKGVYIVGEDKIIEFKEVSLGKLQRDKFEVLSGLKEGERIVANIVATPVQEGAKVNISKDHPHPTSPIQGEE